MNRENDETWSAEEIEEWQHDEWLRVQEMGDEAYIKVEEEEEAILDMEDVCPL